MSQAKKVFWPISPNESEKKADIRLKNFIEVFSKIQPLEIHPVYVLSSDYFVTSEYFEPIDVQALKENMIAECKSYLNQNFAGVPLQDVVVLENSFSAKGAEVSLFVEYVKEKKPDFVLMSSHGRSGWSRTFLGSFAESFLLHSVTPTILLGPQCEEIEHLQTALMPIQLSESSQKFVENFLDDHRLAFLKKLTLFHKISMVDIEEIAWAPSLYGFGANSSQDLIKKAHKTTTDYFEALLKHPLSEKRLDYKISEKLEAVSDVVVEESRSHDMLVMRTEANTLEANLLGSVTREVVRQSPRPVIVYPHLFKKS